MSSDTFPHDAPEASNFAPLVSKVSQLLGSDLKARIRDDLNPLQRTTTAEPANEERIVSAHDELVAAVNHLKEAQNALETLKTYFDAAEKYATEQLKFHSAFKIYFDRTTDQLALRSELVAPIRRLPNEVLQLIFLEVYAQSSEEERYNPITAQVCTFWRQLAEATPLLWTTINVNLKVGGEDGMNAVARMETRIKRAKRSLVAVHFSLIRPLFLNPRFFLFVTSRANDSTDCPFSPSSHLPPDSGCIPPSAREFEAAITTLLKYSNKVASLRIPRHEGGLGDYLVARCETDNVTFNNLHTLSLYDGQYLPEGFDAEPLLKACPNIIRLRIFEAPDTPYIHWEQMKEFRGCLKTQALSAFLSRGRDVEQATILSFHWSTLANIIFSDRLTALSLTSLVDTRLTSAPRPSGLRYLALPGYYDSASALLRSWGSDLEFLAFTIGYDINAKSLKNLLTNTPNLQGLRLRGDRPTPPNVFSLLPKLTHLEIYTAVDALSERATRKLLSRPLKPTSRAKRLQLRSVAFLPPVGRYLRPRSELLDKDNPTWKPLYQDLEDVGVEVHEYRTLETFDTPGFDTPFFKERGWCV